MIPPTLGEYGVFAALGVLLGAFVNACVVRFRLIPPIPRGPWQSPPENGFRSLADRIPIVGWLRLRRESEWFGRFWLRSLSVEILGGILLPIFWYWSRMGGGFPEDWVAALSANDWEAVWRNWGLARFASGVVLIVGMSIATLIDLDEWTIPDEVTITLTLVALALAVAGLAGPLPIRTDSTTGPWTLEGALPKEDATPRPLTVASPGDLRWSNPEYWGNRSSSLWTGLAILAVWGFGLIPKLATLRWGFAKGLRLMIASILRPARKRKGRLKPKPRRIYTVTWIYLAVTLLGMLLLALGWWRGDQVWQATSSAVVGLGVGAGVVWAIRIVGGYAFGVEAMGFGDVTLMGMIGAFLGWQVALFVFFLSPFIAIIVTGVKFIATRETHLPYGPYLCLATAVIVVNWEPFWLKVAAPYLSMLDGIMLEFGAMFFVLATLVLLVVGWMRNRDDIEASSST